MDVVSEGDGKLVSALVRGITVLRCFTPKQQELSARELADMTGLPKPTLFRLVDTLCELGLMRYSERLSKYVPGVGLLQLSSPALARLCEGQVQLAVGWRRQLSLVELANGMGNAVFRPEMGVQMSLSRTASGRAYLLGQPEPVRAAYLQDLEREDPARAAMLAQRLQDAREDLVQHGFCRSHGDLHNEIESIAVPMSQPIDGELWVFAVSLPVFSPLCSRLESDLGPRLRTLVRSVEGGLGTSGLS